MLDVTFLQTEVFFIDFCAILVSAVFLTPVLQLLLIFLAIFLLRIDIFLID